MTPSPPQRDPGREPPGPVQADNARTVMVPLDGSAHALVALPVARTLAELWRATLHIVHVGERTLPPEDALRALGLDAGELRGTVIDQETGLPGEAIVRLSRERNAAFVVLCTHTGTEPSRGVLGTVARAVVHDAPCPAVLVHPDRGTGAWTPRRILVPHDGTPTSAAAITPAADLADRADSELIVLHSADPGTGQPLEPGTYTAPTYVDQPQYEWPEWTHEFLDRLLAVGHPLTGVGLRLLLAHGAAGPEIVRAAGEHHIDLVVLSWRGRWEAGRAATIKTVIEQVRCPVMILRVQPPASETGDGA